MNGAATPGRGRSARKAAASKAGGAGRRGAHLPVTPGGPGVPSSRRSVRGADHREDGACAWVCLTAIFAISRSGERGARGRPCRCRISRQGRRATLRRGSRSPRRRSRRLAILVRLERAEIPVRQWIHERTRMVRSRILRHSPPAPPRAASPSPTSSSPSPSSTGWRCTGSSATRASSTSCTGSCGLSRGRPTTGRSPPGSSSGSPRWWSRFGTGRLCISSVVELGQGHDRGEPGRGAAPVLRLSRQEAKQVAAEILPAAVVPRRTVVTGGRPVHRLNSGRVAGPDG